MLIQTSIIELNEKINAGGIFGKYTSVIFVSSETPLPSKLNKKLLDEEVGIFIIEPVSQEQRLESIQRGLEVYLYVSAKNNVLLFKNNKLGLVKINKPNQLNNIVSLLQKKGLKAVQDKFKTEEYEPLVLFHLSDLHLGNKNVEKNLPLLEETLTKKTQNIRSNFVITGDVCDSPNIKNMEIYEGFKGFLEKISHHETIMVPGNHDVDTSGIAVTKATRNLFASFKKYPDITLLEENKIAFLLFNSNEPEGQLALAKGKIGKEQLLMMDNELNLLKTKVDLNQYRLIALLHHHITLIRSPKQYKGGLIRKILYNEKTQTLIDKEIFTKWLSDNDVHLVLHGHRHVPYITKVDDIDVISCGSSTGNIELKKKEKMFITFNVINTDSNLVMEYFVTSDGEEEVIIKPLDSFKKQF